MKSKVVKFKKKVGSVPAGFEMIVEHRDDHSYPHVQEILKALSDKGLASKGISLSTNDYEIKK